MVNQFGEPYASLPAAFKFRIGSTRQQVRSHPDYGQIALAELPGGSRR